MRSGKRFRAWEGDGSRRVDAARQQRWKLLPPAPERDRPWSSSIDPVLSRRMLMRSGLAALLGIGVRQVWATPDEADSLTGKDARELARSIIPFDRLTPPTQERLWGVVGRPSMHRRMPGQVIPCDPDLYLFFLRNPDVVVNMWQLMGATSMQLKRTGNFTFDARDNAGTQARIELVYGTPDTHVFLADGAYEGQLLKRRTPGRCVMVLKSDYARDAAQRVQVTNQLDAFVQIDQPGAELIVKTLQPVIGKTADHNFKETLSFVSRVSQTLERNATGVQRLASRLTALDPATRDKFVQVATNVYHRAVLRQPDGQSSFVEIDEQRPAAVTASAPASTSSDKKR